MSPVSSPAPPRHIARRTVPRGWGQELCLVPRLCHARQGKVKAMLCCALVYPDAERLNILHRVVYPALRTASRISIDRVVTSVFNNYCMGPDRSLPVRFSQICRHTLRCSPRYSGLAL
jgi:hypothetical protein